MGRGALNLARLRNGARIRAGAATYRATTRCRAVVLLYHRVTDLAADPLSLAIRPEHFAQHLEVVRRMGEAMQLGELVARVADGTAPPRAVAVTIDDGYADSVGEALPLLQRYDVPATLFVTSGPVRAAEEFWWDSLERVLLAPGELPPRLSLEVTGFHYARDLAGAASYPAAEAARHRGWTLTAREDPTARHRAFRELHERCYRLEPRVRAELLRALHEWAGIPLAARADHRAISPTELAGVAEGGLVEIGAHSVTHPAFDRIPADSQRTEIRECRYFLEEVTGRPVRGLSYPHGRYDAFTLEIVRETGFRYAAAADPGGVSSRTSAFRVPRLYIPDEGGEAFAARLRRWLGPEPALA